MNCLSRLQEHIERVAEEAIEENREKLRRRAVERNRREREEREERRRRRPKFKPKCHIVVPPELFDKPEFKAILLELDPPKQQRQQEEESYLGSLSLYDILDQKIINGELSSPSTNSNIEESS